MSTIDPHFIPGIKEQHRQQFCDTVHLLLRGNEFSRNNLMPEELDGIFTDILTAGGGVTYQDGRTATIGAYSALLDYAAVNATCTLFSSDELTLIAEVNRKQGYLSPSFSLLASWIELTMSQRFAVQ